MNDVSFTTSRKVVLRTTALAAAAVMALGLGLQAGSAGAAEPTSPGAATAVSPSQRTADLRAAQAEAGATAKELRLGAQEKLIARDVITDADGTVHTRYERTYAGLPVLGGDLIVHVADDGAVAGVDKATSAKIAVASTAAAISSATAEKKATTTAVAADNTGTAAETPRKVVWARAGKPVLAFETVVNGVQPDGTPSELHVVTDAATGKVLDSEEHIETGSGESMYSGSVSVGTTANGSTFDLVDSVRGNHKTYNLNHGTTGTGTLFNDADDAWGDGTPGNAQTAGVDAAYGAAMTWDFYKSAFGRNGIANDGKAAYSRVHYGNAYVNAFWSDSCFCMTYGDGSGDAHPLTSIDVAGHEMTHGLTSRTANLAYRGESGGLNEATSDIFGTAVEWYAANTADAGDYLIGEKIDIRGNGTPLRYMDKPSKDGNSADYWSSSLKRLNVHYSSGPANHFFYLLSEGSGAKTIGGVNYDSPTYDGSTVAGIGRDKAAQIWYKALTTYMTSSTNYAAARVATLSAATDLYGATSAEVAAVNAAWAAVNVK